MIELLVAASSVVGRAGLKATLEEVPDCVVIGAVDSAAMVERALELQPDAVVWQISQQENVGGPLLALQDIPFVLLTDRSSSELIRAGARAVLPMEASGEQIGAAAQAAVLGLVVTLASNHASEERVSTVLTPREREVLRMIGDGLANKEIAYRLGISEHTVKFHVSALLGKLGAGTRAEAIRIGIAQGAILM